MKTIVPFIICFLKKNIITFNNLQFCEENKVDFSFISTKHEPFIPIKSYIYCNTHQTLRIRRKLFTGNLWVNSKKVSVKELKGS